MRIFQKYILPALEILFIAIFYLLFCTYDWTDSTFDTSILKTPKIYITTVLLSFISTYIFGFIQQRIVAYAKSYHPNTSADYQTRLFKTIKTNEIKCKKAYENTDIVEDGVKRYNDDIFEKMSNIKLHTVHSKIYYTDISLENCRENYEGEIERLEKHFCIVSPRKKKKFEKIMEKVVTGDIKCEHVTAEQILVSGFADDQRVNGLVNKSNRIKTTKSIIHALQTAAMFMSTSIIFMQLIFSFNLEILTTYMFYIIFAVIGGGAYGASMILYYTTLYKNRNGFFVKYCNILDEWHGEPEITDFKKLTNHIEEELKNETKIHQFETSEKVPD